MRGCRTLLFAAFFLCVLGMDGKGDFSTAEQANVRVKDPTIFRDSSAFVIHLEWMTKQNYSFPLPGAKVISPYGTRKGRTHSGIDMKTKPNDTIRSVFSGVVRMAKLYSGYGNVIVIRHTNGLESVYSHNSKNLVKPNQSVKAGDAIALVGRTGRATTEHLHFELRVNGEHFNPNIIFNVKEEKLRKEPIVCRKNKNGIWVKPLSTTIYYVTKPLYVPFPSEVENFSLEKSLKTYTLMKIQNKE